MLEDKSMATTKSGGLAGIIAGQTAIATVGKEGMGLTYRGYSIHDLAEHSTFEEVAYLLIYGRSPKQTSSTIQAQAARLRGLPAPLKTVLEQIPATTHPMDVMRTGCSMLGTLEPEGHGSRSNRGRQPLARRCFRSMLLYWHHFATTGKRIETETDDDSIAGHFLHLLHGKQPDELHRRAMDVSLILYAEHEFNASTFTARTIASTLSDFYSAVTGGIGALRGPLHGGANEAAMELIEQFATPDEAEAGVLDNARGKEAHHGLRPSRSTKCPTRARTSSRHWAKKLADARRRSSDSIRSPSASSR